MTEGKDSHLTVLSATMSFFKEIMLVDAAVTFLSEGFCFSVSNKTDILLYPSLQQRKKSVQAVTQNKSDCPTEDHCLSFEGHVRCDVIT